MKRLQFKSYQVVLAAGVMALGLLLTPMVSGSSFQPQGQKRLIAAGEKLKLKGVVLQRNGETLVIRDTQQMSAVVLLTDSTTIETTRKGVFRGGKTYAVTSILQGLILEVEGIGDTEGRLIARDVRFKEEDLHAAITASARANPIEAKADANTQNIEANRAKADANAQNIEANKQSIAGTNARISELDEWELVRTVTVYFAINSVTLSAEAKATLDEIGPKANEAKNYKVEVAGFADSTGNAEKNLELSQQRADNVVQYLAVKYNVPLRRISTPMGYGATQASGGAGAEARTKDRRVDVRIFVNKAAR